MDAQKLILHGYKKISNKFRTISRIDRPDWMVETYKKHFDHTDIGIIEEVEAFCNGMPIEDFGFTTESVRHEEKIAADRYGRFCSKDIIKDIPAETFGYIPTS